MRWTRILSAGALAAVCGCCWPAPPPDETRPDDSVEPPQPAEPERSGDVTRRSLLSDQLVLTVPVEDAPTALASPIVPGVAEHEVIYVGTDPRLELSLDDLAARLPEMDAGGALARELTRSWPDATPAGAPAAMPIDDPDLRVLRAPYDGPDVGSPPIVAYLVALPDGHTVLIRVELRWPSTSRADGRALADALMQTIEPGAARWSTPAGQRAGYELFDEVTVPAGWARDLELGGNEEPPYVTPYQELLAPERVVGAPPRLAVVVRSGTCATRARDLLAPRWGSEPTDVEAMAGTMFGQPITWRRFGPALCWEDLDPEDPYGGVAWEIYAVGAEDRAAALSVTSSAAE